MNAIVNGEPVDLAPSDGGSAAPAPNTDEQVARAVLEGDRLVGTFHRLGNEARPEFAWRCTSVAQRLSSALDEFFKEALR